MHLNSYILLSLFVLGGIDLSGQVLPSRAVEIASTYTQTVVSEAYATTDVVAVLRTDGFALPGHPERFWIELATPAQGCDSAGISLGELYIQFENERILNVQWLPQLEARSEVATKTRAAVLEWLTPIFGLDKQIAAEHVPSDIPTEHLRFLTHNPKWIATLVIDARAGFLHRAYLSRR